MRFWISAALILLTLFLALFLWWWHWEEDLSHKFDPQIREASAKYGLPEELIRAVIWRESDFDSQATGKAGERGLMQVTPPAAFEWAKAEKIENFQPTDLFDPRTNIHAGTWYLARAAKRWKHTDDPIVFALAEYNAGRTHALRWASGMEQPRAIAFIKAIDYPTTRKYIETILERYDLHRNELKPSLWKQFTSKVSRRLEAIRNSHNRPTTTDSSNK